MSKPRVDPLEDLGITSVALRFRGAGPLVFVRVGLESVSGAVQPAP